MKNSIDGQQQKNWEGRGNNGIIPSSVRAFSSYLRIVSAGASSVARSAASFVDRDDDNSNDQVRWAGFDKLEYSNDVIRRVLLLGYRSGFQVWDVDEADNVRNLVSRYDGPVSFIQLLPKPVASKNSDDKFAQHRPVLVICSNGALSGANSIRRDSGNDSGVATVVRFYSLPSQTYVHTLKFRSAVYSVRCSSRVVAISQAAQIHCFDATTLEREYTILTNPVTSTGIGYGPLAVGPRWLAYSGSPVAVSNTGRVSPQHLTPSASYNSNGSIVAHYAKESSKQLAAGIVTLGDIGYKKLSRYYSELRPDSNGSHRSGNGFANGHSPDADNIGMVVVRDIVGKVVISQFRAHKSPISSLCFDPSGTLLVTASVHGHNINVYKIMPACDASASYSHLYCLQRGLTNAVIQDISFSDDSNWIMISSSRGTSHLFSISPFGGSVNFRSSDASNTTKTSPPVTLSAVSRIRNGTNGRFNSLSGAVASSFHNFEPNKTSYLDNAASKLKKHLLVFSPSGCVVQYLLRISGPTTAVEPGVGTTCQPGLESDGQLVVEPVKKWNICQKHNNRRERDDNVDVNGENGNLDDNKNYYEGKIKGNSVFPEARKASIGTEENRHLFISEAELQMHQLCIPIWEKPEIYFQPMVTEGIKAVLSGEVEIERIPTRTIESRSKNLVPVFHHLRNARHLQHKSGVEEIGWNGPTLTAEAMAFVNNCVYPKTNNTQTWKCK